ncbi:hypothetical protein ACTXT7_016179 [Hymenolepis weldensis]
MATRVMRLADSASYYHSLNSSPKATTSFVEVVLIDVLRCSCYCFHEREFGVMEMLINFLFNHAPPHPARNNPKVKVW